MYFEADFYVFMLHIFTTFFIVMYNYNFFTTSIYSKAQLYFFSINAELFSKIQLMNMCSFNITKRLKLEVLIICNLLTFRSVRVFVSYDKYATLT